MTDPDDRTSTSVYVSIDDTTRVRIGRTKAGERDLEIVTIGGVVSIVGTPEQITRMVEQIRPTGEMALEDEPPEPEAYEWRVGLRPDRDGRVIQSLDRDGVVVDEFEVSDLEWHSSEGKLRLLLQWHGRK